MRVLSEMDFLNLMTKRRIEKSLHDVLYLQMFLKPKVENLLNSQILLLIAQNILERYRCFA